MKPEIKERWVKALRSGEYEQTTGILHGDEGYCCLGVLCDLYAKEHDVFWNYNSNTMRYDMFGEDLNLPLKVVEWASVNRNPAVVQEGMGTTTLSFMNDGGFDFNQIAQIIEEQL